jgi:hypothetical protein
MRNGRDKLRVSPPEVAVFASLPPPDLVWRLQLCVTLRGKSRYRQYQWQQRGVFRSSFRSNSLVAAVLAPLPQLPFQKGRAAVALARPHADDCISLEGRCWTDRIGTIDRPRTLLWLA